MYFTDGNVKREKTAINGRIDFKFVFFVQSNENKCNFYTVERKFSFFFPANKRTEE